MTEQKIREDVIEQSNRDDDTEQRGRPRLHRTHKTEKHDTGWRNTNHTKQHHLYVAKKLEKKVEPGNSIYRRAVKWRQERLSDTFQSTE